MYTLLGEVWTVYCCLGTDIVWFGTSSPLTAPMTPNSHVCRASWALQSVCQMPAKQNTLFIKHIICVCVSRLVVFNYLQLHGLQLMASGPITSWQIDGKTVEMVTDFILGGSKITADGDCNHEIKGRLLLRRKAMANLDSILKSRDIALLTNVHLVKAMVFPVVMYGCESWTIKKAEHRRIDAFELWCWKRLESPLDCRKIKPVNPKGSQSWICWKDWCWSWISNSLVTWCEELTHWKRPWWRERLRAGGEGDNRGWGTWMASQTQQTWILQAPGVDEGQGRMVCCSSWGHRVRHDWVTELNWTVACQAPLSMEFSRQEYWSGLPFSPQEDLPNLGIKSRSPVLQADSLPSEPPGKHIL